MNPDHVKAVLADRSRLGRRVLLLLATLAEHGLTPISVLQKTLPHGVRGELNAAYRADYIAKTPQGLELLPLGKQVVMWVVGKSSEPRHWTQFEDTIRVKERLGK